MTVKELIGITKLSRQTIVRKIKEFYPDIVVPKVAIDLSEEQAIKVMEDLRKKGFINPVQNGQELVQNGQVNTETQNATDRMDRLELMFSKLIEMNMVLIQNQTQKQLEYKQDYYSIIGYANYKGIKDMTVSEARRLSLEAKKLSQELGKEIRSIPDERWGKANSYHVEILDKIFEM